ncbi:hypothetical protein ACFLTS_03030 [Chloroflexota bacterium]
MKRKDLKNVAIVGVYTTEQGYLVDRTTMSLYAEGIKGALDDAGMKKEEIDGIANDWHVWLSQFDPMKMGTFGYPGWWGQYLKTNIRWYYPLLGSFAVWNAAIAISTGQCNTVLIPNAMSVSNLAKQVGRDAMVKAMALPTEFVGPWGPILPSWYAMVARLHMHHFGTTSEQMAEVAVAMREWAIMNPEAMMYSKGPLTTQDVLNSRMICDPLHLLDICLANDGGYFILMTTAERAKDCRKPPVYILGGGECHRLPMYINAPRADSSYKDWHPTPAAEAGQAAFQMAGVTHDDIDVAEIYDCFTITVIKMLEDLGFCKQGEGGSFVEGGTLRPGGKLPCNTHGGLLSHSHNGVPGAGHVIEAVRQLRGECGPRQLKDPKIALALNQGGPFAYASTVILSKEPPS